MANVPVQGSLPSYGNIRFGGNIPVVGELPVETEVPVDTAVPVRTNVNVDGNLGLEGTIPINTTLGVNTTIPVSCQPRVGGDLAYRAVLPLHGSIPVDAMLPVTAAIPVATQRAATESVSVQRTIKPAQAPTETVTVERFVTRVAKKEPLAAPEPSKTKPKEKERIKDRSAADVPPPRYSEPPRAIAPAAVAAPAYIDPRPLLKTEHEKAHDFEYHREGGYVARRASLNTVPHATNTYGGLATGPLVDRAIAPIVPSDADRAWTHTPAAPVGVDNRPPLHIEHEKVHDFEVHREGGYAKGHTIVGARPSMAVKPVVSGPAADSRRAYGGVGPTQGSSYAAAAYGGSSLSYSGSSSYGNVGPSA